MSAPIWLNPLVREGHIVIVATSAVTAEMHCERCQRCTEIHLPISNESLIAVLRDFRSQHLDCPEKEVE